MKHIKRCYGCDRLIMPWSETVDTEKVGVIHKRCIKKAILRCETYLYLKKWLKIQHDADIAVAKYLLGLKE